MISTGDKIRIALMPMHLLVGTLLIYRFIQGPRTPMVLVLGILLILYGTYRLSLAVRGMRKQK